MKIIFKNSSAVFTTYKLSEKTKVLFDSPYFAGLTSKQKSYLDYFIISMMNKGIWQKLKRFYVPCFTTADGGFINIVSSVESGQIVIDSMGGNVGTNYYCIDYRGINVNAGFTEIAFTDNYTIKKGYSMFGYAINGTLGFLYNTNKNRLTSRIYDASLAKDICGLSYTDGEGNEAKLGVDYKEGCVCVISAKRDLGVVTNLESYAEIKSNCVPSEDFTAKYYIGYYAAQTINSLIKYFGVGEGLTSDEVKFMAEKMNTLNTVL